MTDTLTTTIKIDNWDEQPTQEHDDGTKTAHAVVTLTDGNDGVRSGLLESVLHYGSDGTSEYAGLIRLEAERSKYTQYYEVELERKAVHLTHDGVAEAQRAAGVGSMYVGEAVTVSGSSSWTRSRSVSVDTSLKIRRSPSPVFAHSSS